MPRGGERSTARAVMLHAIGYAPFVVPPSGGLAADFRLKPALRTLSKHRPPDTVGNTVTTRPPANRRAAAKAKALACLRDAGPHVAVPRATRGHIHHCFGQQLPFSGDCGLEFYSKPSPVR